MALYILRGMLFGKTEDWILYLPTNWTMYGYMCAKNMVSSSCHLQKASKTTLD